MAEKTIAMQMVEALERICSPPPEGIGRTPTRDEFQKHSKYPRSQIDNIFGSYVEFLLAAGRNSKNHRKKVDRQEIRERVFEKLKEDVADKKEIIIPIRITKSLLCISDMHHPYGHQDTIPFLSAINDKYKFDSILIGGDEIDAHAISFHDHDPDLLSPGHELKAAISSIKPLYDIFPNAMILSSNHGDLFYRKGKHHGLPRHILKSYNEVLGAPIGWIWSEEHKFQFPNGRTAIAHHGYSSNILMASKKRASSLIQFHFHSSFSIQYWRNREALHFALQCACLIDDTSLAMEYNKLTLERPIIGVGAVFYGLPRLLPMILDDKNRWTGFIP